MEQDLIKNQTKTVLLVTMFKNAEGNLSDSGVCKYLYWEHV